MSSKRRSLPPPPRRASTWPRTASWLAALVVIAFAGKIAYDASPTLRPMASDAGVDGGDDASSANSAGPASNANAASGNLSAASASGGNATDFGSPFGDASTLGLGELGLPTPADSSERATSDAGPRSKPRQVRFGVIIVEYNGAQGAKSGRSKEAAARLAKDLTDEAQTDFKSAVRKGDSGSMDDAGHIQRGVLEGPAEDALFSSAVGDVSGPVDTPRGYWIVKRLE